MLQNRPIKHPFQACTAGHVAVKIRLHTSHFEKRKNNQSKKTINPKKKKSTNTNLPMKHFVVNRQFIERLRYQVADDKDNNL
jgi:hypothetical protein